MPNAKRQRTSAAEEVRNAATVNDRASGNRRENIPDLRNLRSVAEFVDAHRQHGDNYTDATLGATWNLLGKLMRRDRMGKERRYLSQHGHKLKPLVEHTMQAVPSMNARNVANIAHGLAIVETDARWRGGDALWNVLARAAVARVGDFNAQDLANTAYAFTTAGHASPALFDAIARAAVVRVGDFNEQNLANTAYAFATSGHASPVLFDAIARASAARVGDFKPQELSNTAYAYATAGHSSPALFTEPVERRADERGGGGENAAGDV